MCGRYGFINSDYKTYGVTRKPEGFQPSYNIAPSMHAPQVYTQNGRRVALMKFGLVPSWSKNLEIKFSTINATVERVFESPVYRGPIHTHRCLTPVNFYFEWKVLSDKTKQPYVFRLKNTQSFAFGSIYDIWKDVESHEFPSFSIITTPPNDVAVQYHHRMPLIVPKEHWDTWLDPNLTEQNIKKLMIPYPHPEHMEVYAVSTRVNSPRNQDEGVIEPVEQTQFTF